MRSPSPSPLAATRPPDQSSEVARYQATAALTAIGPGVERRSAPGDPRSPWATRSRDAASADGRSEAERSGRREATATTRETNNASCEAMTEADSDPRSARRPPPVGRASTSRRATARDRAGRSRQGRPGRTMWVRTVALRICPARCRSTAVDAGSRRLVADGLSHRRSTQGEDHVGRPSPQALVTSWWRPNLEGAAVVALRARRVESGPEPGVTAVAATRGRGARTLGVVDRDLLEFRSRPGARPARCPAPTARTRRRAISASVLSSPRRCAAGSATAMTGTNRARSS